MTGWRFSNSSSVFLPCHYLVILAATVSTVSSKCNFHNFTFTLAYTRLLLAKRPHKHFQRNVHSGTAHNTLK